MIIELPVTNEAAQEFVSTLNGVDYRFNILFNDRNTTWTLSLQDDVSGNYLIAGVPLLLGQDVLEPYNLGIGSLGVVSNDQTDNDATADDFGTRIKLVYFSPDELV